MHQLNMNLIWLLLTLRIYLYKKHTEKIRVRVRVKGKCLLIVQVFFERKRLGMASNPSDITLDHQVNVETNNIRLLFRD